MHYLTFDFDLRVTHNISQYPLHHVAFEPSKFALGTSKGLGDTFTRGPDKLSVQLGIYPTRFLAILLFFKKQLLKNIFFAPHIFLKLLIYKYLILVMEETHRSKCFAQIL